MSSRRFVIPARALGFVVLAAATFAPRALALLGPGTDCADLEIIKTASDSRVPIGERLTFVLEVSNRGPLPAVDVEVVDAIPEEFSVVGVQRPAGWTSTVISDVVRVTTPLLAPGTTAFIEIEVEALTARQAVVNEATVSSKTTDCDRANNTDEATVRIHALSDPGVPTLSTFGLALLVLLMGVTLLRVARGSA